MNHNVYLPDELGQRVKDAKPELNLSGLLRAAVIEELERRKAMSETLEKNESVEYKLELADGAIGRLTGREIGNDDAVVIYLTDDERVIVYNGDSGEHWEVTDDPEDGLNGFPQDVYVEAMQALGLKPIIDI